MTHPFRRAALAAATLCVAALVISPPARAAAEGIEVTDAWARATAPGAPNGAAYLTIRNTSGGDDRLIAASADVSETVELHTHIMDGDIMRMREVDAIAAPAGTTTELKPGGLHIMFIGLKQPLREGETFPLSLTFETGGETEVDVVVRSPGAMQQDGHSHHGRQ